MSAMQNRSLLAILLAAALAGAAAQPATAAEGASRLGLDDFSTAKVGNFPKRWRTWPLQRSAAERVYSIGEEGGKRFIKAYDAEDASQQIFLSFPWALAERPTLSWRWRATMLPEGAKESDDATNDSACGVYVTFGRTSGHAIKYVWSTTLPAGTVVTRRGGDLKIKVLDSGAARLKSWTPHAVNVLADYEALFGKKAEKDPSGIGILTDGNAVHKPAGCDYNGFAIEGAS